MHHLDGINVNPTPIVAGENVTIEYGGVLSDSGAQEVYLHAGIGERWQDTKTIKMNRTPEGVFKTTVRLNTADKFNFCFKDSAENWDNNDGYNWSYDIHENEPYN